MATEAQGEERRRFHRIGFQADAWLKIAERTIPVEILDISLAGALLNIDSAGQAEDGAAVVLNVELGSDVEFDMSGSLIPHGDGNFALHRDLSLVEDDFHLRRLLELNLGDAKLMERDIEALVTDHTQFNLN